MVNEELLNKILKRSGPMFADDLEMHRAHIVACGHGSRIMMIGDKRPGGSSLKHYEETG